MPEAKAVFARQPWPVGSDQLLPHERGELRCHRIPVRAQRLDGPAVEDLSFDRSPLEHPALSRLQAIKPRSEQRPQRGWNHHLPSAIGDHRHDLLDEERIAAGHAPDLRAQLRVETGGDQCIDVVIAQRVEV